MADLTALYDEADRLKEDGQYEAAIEKLNALLEQDEHYVLAHLALAVLLAGVGRHEEAVRHGQRACELEPEDAFNHTAMSVTCQRAFTATRNPEYIALAEQAMGKARTLQFRQG